MKKIAILVTLILTGCSAYGPGFAGHPLDCAIGIAWGDCAPGTPGYNNGHREPQVIYVVPSQPNVNVTVNNK
jgi:hypothetical protein